MSSAARPSTDDLSFITGIYRRDGDNTLFRGSGFVAANGWVLTCKHVVKEPPPEGVRARGEMPDIPLEDLWVEIAGKQVAAVDCLRSPDRDIALLELPPGVTGTPVKLFESAGPGESSDWLDRDFRAFGYPEQEQGHRLLSFYVLLKAAGVDVASGDLCYAQFDGGIPNGCSGGPVVEWTAAGWVVVGMSYLGSDRSGTSGVVPAVALVEYLRKHRVSFASSADLVADIVLEPDPGRPERQVLRGAATLTLTERPRAVDATETSNPYLGLEPFHSSDFATFFGRRRLAGELWRALRGMLTERNRAHPLLLPVVGPSGAGKSSLIRAGLLPKLVRRPLPGLSDARVLIMQPGDDPLGELAAHLGWATQRDPVAVRAQLDAGPQGLKQLLATLSDIDARPIILVLDQFETLITQCADVAVREAFIALLMAAMSGPHLRLLPVLSLRSDFLIEFEAFPAFKALIDARLSSLKRRLNWEMSDDDLYEAIERPARMRRRKFPGVVVARLVSEAHDHPGALPMLEFALQRLWQAMDEKRPIEDLIGAGGIGELLSNGAEEVYKGLEGPAAQAIARRLFTRAVLDGGTGSYTRRRIPLDELQARGDTAEQLKQVLDRFTNANSRLLTKVAEPNGSPAVELTHEVLLEHWRRVRDWLKQDRDSGDRETRDALLAASGEPRKHWHLWNARKLAAAGSFLERRGEDLTADEWRFIGASRRRRNTVYAMVAVVVAALCGLTVSSLYQHHRAEKANTDLTRANTDLAGSLARAKTNERRFLAIEARYAFDAGDWDRGLATALAALPAAGEQTPALPAELITELERAVYRDRRAALLPSTVGELINLRTVPGRSALAVLGRGDRGDTRLTLWDARAGGVVASYSHPDWQALRDFWLSADGERLLGIDDDNKLSLWSLEPKPTRLFSRSIGDAKWDINGALSRLLVLDPDGRLTEWSLPSGGAAPASLPAPITRHTGWRDLWLSPDGSHLAVMEEDGRLVLLRRDGQDWHERAWRPQATVESLRFVGTSPFPLVLQRSAGKTAVRFLGSERGIDPYLSLPPLPRAQLARLRRILWVADDYRRLLVENEGGELVLLGPGTTAITLTRQSGGRLRAAVLAADNRIAFDSPDGVQLMALSGSPAPTDAGSYSIVGSVAEPVAASATGGAIALFASSPRPLPTDPSGHQVLHRNGRGTSVLCDSGTGTLLLRTSGRAAQALPDAPSCAARRGRSKQLRLTASLPNVRFSADGKRLLLWSRSHPSLSLYDAVSAERLGAVEVEAGGSVREAELDADGTRVVIASTHGRLMLWQPGQDRPARFGTPIDHALRVDLSASGSLIAAVVHHGDADSTRLRVWSTEGERELRCDIARQQGDFVAIDFEPTDVDSTGRLLSASADGLVTVWSVTAQGCTEQVRIDSGVLLADAAWAPGRDRVVLLEDQGRASLWDLHTGGKLSEAEAPLAKQRWISTSGEGGVVLRDPGRVLYWGSRAMDRTDLAEWSRYRAFRGLTPFERQRLFPPPAAGMANVRGGAPTPGSAAARRPERCEPALAGFTGGTVNRVAGDQPDEQTLRRWRELATQGAPDCHRALGRYHESGSGLGSGAAPDWQRALFHYSSALRLQTELFKAGRSAPMPTADDAETLARRGAVARQLAPSEVLAVARVVARWRPGDPLPTRFPSPDKSQP